MRLRYVGLRPFKMIVKDESYLLNEGDVVDVDPWKIRSKRLTMLFEPVVEEGAVLSKREKKYLKVNNRR